MANTGKINLAEKFALINEYWSPRIIGELNGQHVKLVKMQGPFTWHSHLEEDELFLVLDGHLKMEFRDHTEEISAGSLIIVPKGTEHRPLAAKETLVLLFEPVGTINTGDAGPEMRTDHPEWI